MRGRPQIALDVEALDPKKIGNDSPITLLREIRDEIRALRLLIEARAPRAPGDPRYVELVRCISRFAGDRRFSTWELLDHATLAGSGELRDALCGALGAAHATNGRKLGKLLLRLEDVDLSGLRVVRDGDENGAARWRIGVLGV